MGPMELLADWRRRAQVRTHAHTRAAVSFERRSRLMAGAVILFSTAVGAGIFAGASPSPVLKTVAGLLSLGAAVLSSLQAGLKYPEMVAQHKASALKFGRLRREIEVQMVSPGQPEYSTLLNRLQQEFADMIEQSPAIPQRIFDKSKAAVSADSQTPVGNGAKVIA